MRQMKMFRSLRWQLVRFRAASIFAHGQTRRIRLMRILLKQCPLKFPLAAEILQIFQQLGT